MSIDIVEFITFNHKGEQKQERFLKTDHDKFFELIDDYTKDRELIENKSIFQVDFYGFKTGDELLYFGFFRGDNFYLREDFAECISLR
ncbi:hypothetical protein [Bacillus sp. SB47]|uniref:hypothetical protein n=1 Tax=Bacillus sp. SB47 TaxID=1071079 RepID=UPI0003FFCBB2|nr:hypothetical protein [Bacillus sp. SB47]